jgi:hypothetical protein
MQINAGTEKGPSLAAESSPSPTNPHVCPSLRKEARGSHYRHAPQPSEPILFPKLRIYFADFPYPHCSIVLEADHLGDLMRL